MIFLTAMTLGIVAGLSRSAFTMAMTAVLIGVAFGVAALVSTGPLALYPFLLAIAGYNFGLIDLMLAALVIHRLRAA